MAVITISRELGSEGGLIAERAALALGYHVADKSTIAAILNDYGLVEFMKDYDSLPGFWDRFDTQRREQRNTLISMLNQTILALAQHGDMIILGRGGYAVLAGLADVMNVRIQAPFPLRVRRLTELPAVAEPSRAEQLVKENDRLQRIFVKSVYDADWDSVKGWDLMIDTGKISPETAVDGLVAAARALEARDLSCLRTTAQLDVDRVLAAAVADHFKCEKIHNLIPALAHG